MARAHEPERTPAVAVWALRIGGGIAAFCGGLLSFVALYRLGLENGWPPYAAWALPTAVDSLVVTAFIVAMSVSRRHAASAIAHICAGIAMVLTTGCNVLYHALLPATTWSAGHIALVATGAAPALVVELIIVMQMYLGDGATLVAQQDEPATRRRDGASRSNVATAASGATPKVAQAATGDPVAAPERTATVAPSHLPDQAERNARDRTILALLGSHGRDRVTGPMVGAALGIHRANGARQLARVLEAVDAGTLAIPEPDDEPEREPAAS